MRALLLAFLAIAAGCGSSGSSTTPATDSGTPGADVADSGQPEAETSVDARDPKCNAIDAELQTAVDGARGKAPNAILAVKDETCGLRTIISGDPATARTPLSSRTGSASGRRASSSTSPPRTLHISRPARTSTTRTPTTCCWA